MTSDIQFVVMTKIISHLASLSVGRCMHLPLSKVYYGLNYNFAPLRMPIM